MSPSSRWSLRALVAALAYALLGWGALALAIPPGFASPIWPPAGVSLGLTWLWGAPGWIGTAAGSLALNLAVSGDAVAYQVALGAGAQALLGAGLLASVASSRVLAPSPRTMAAVVLAAAASCAVNGLVGPLSLLSAGLITDAQLWPHIATWWAGDAVGAVVALPIVLAWLTPVVAWRRRRMSASLPLLVLVPTALALEVAPTPAVALAGSTLALVVSVAALASEGSWIGD